MTLFLLFLSNFLGVCFFFFIYFLPVNWIKILVSNIQWFRFFRSSSRLEETNLCHLVVNHPYDDGWKCYFLVGWTISSLGVPVWAHRIHQSKQQFQSKTKTIALSENLLFHPCGMSVYSNSRISFISDGKLKLHRDRNWITHPYLDNIMFSTF